MRLQLTRSRRDYFVLKEQARFLRRQGESYPEIAKKLQLSKGTLSLWCRDITLTEAQIVALGKRYDRQLRGAKANQRKREIEVREIRKVACKEIEKPSREAFRMAGAMLYWGEGNKNFQVAVTNSDPNLVRFMIRWLDEFFGIKPQLLRAHLTLHANQDEAEAIKYWSSLTGIPVYRFGKTYIKQEKIRYRKAILYNGTIRVALYNKDRLIRILSWIDRYKEYILGR